MLAMSPRQQRRDDEGCEERLRPRGEARRLVSVTTGAPVEDLAASNPDLQNGMLGIGQDGRNGADRRGVEDPSPPGQGTDRRDACQVLPESAIRMTMRNSVSGHVKRRSEQDSCKA